MNMLVQKHHLSSAAAIKSIDVSVGADPVYDIIARHQSASRSFADFLREKSDFDAARRSSDGFQDHPDCAKYDAREDELSTAERQAASELVAVSPTTLEGALRKLEYIVAEHDRGDRLYDEDDLIAVMQSLITSGVFHASLKVDGKRKAAKSRHLEAPTTTRACPVYPLAKEFGRLVERYNVLDEEETAARNTGDDHIKRRQKMVLWDRMETIYDEASYLQSTSVVGAAFQSMIVKTHLDVLIDSEGNDQRVLKGRLDRLLYRSVRNLVTENDIAKAQKYLMDPHMDPFNVLDELAEPTPCRRL